MEPKTNDLGQRLGDLPDPGRAALAMLRRDHPTSDHRLSRAGAPPHESPRRNENVDRRLPDPLQVRGRLQHAQANPGAGGQGKAGLRDEESAGENGGAEGEEGGLAAQEGESAEEEQGEAGFGGQQEECRDSVLGLPEHAPQAVLHVT